MLLSDRLFAAHSSNEQTPPQALPLKLESNWALCVDVATDDNDKTDCKVQKRLGAIEDSFPDYDGMAIYTNKFRLEKAAKNLQLSLSIPHLRDADEIYLNGKLLGQTGRFPPDFEKATLYSRNYPIPNNYLLYGKEQANELVIKVYNHARQGGMSSGIPTINETTTIQDTLIAHEGLLMLYVGLMLIISAVQFFYFAAQKQNRDHLYFGLFCIGEAVYILTYSHFIFASGVHLNIIFRLNILLFGVLTLLFFLFLTNFFKCKVSKWFRLPLIWLLSLISLAAVFIHIDSIYHIVHLLQAISIVVLIPFYFYLFYQAIKDKLPYARLMAWTIVVFIGAVLFDFMVDLQLVPTFMSGLEGLVSPIFIIAIFIVITLILIHKHWQYYRNATYDYLTNCLRRSSFIERLNEELHRIHRSEDTMVLALIDIDYFKQFNDQHNHLTGDLVLRTVAKRTKDTLREFDLLGRYGGDEFIVAAQVSDEHDAFQLLKRIHNNITQEPIVLQNKAPVSISVTLGGVTTNPQIATTAEELIEQADEILVKGKVKQKGRVHI
ncbi:GGDEF domain-containing protein [Kangiella sediminilitoris]|uniref:GGDEF domain-containing protein n=1 Tax=Kangiella sediminilitoris TaxID=1144748 RepID=UPI0012E9D47E|nr:GGDEF domain-containing protein [Kangiella sediminilitoris]